MFTDFKHCFQYPFHIYKAKYFTSKGNYSLVMLYT